MALNQKRLMGINLGIVIYFVSIYAIFALKLEHQLIGVFQELLTIPAMLAQVVFLVISVKFLLKKEQKVNLSTKISIVLLAACSIVTITSFL